MPFSLRVIRAYFHYAAPPFSLKASVAAAIRQGARAARRRATPAAAVRSRCAKRGVRVARQGAILTDGTARQRPRLQRSRLAAGLPICHADGERYRLLFRYS